MRKFSYFLYKNVKPSKRHYQMCGIQVNRKNAKKYMWCVVGNIPAGGGNLNPTKAK